MPFDFSLWQIGIVLVIGLLVFGPKRLPELGRGLGSGMRDFRRGLSGEADEPQQPVVVQSTTPVVETATAGTAEPVPAAAPVAEPAAAAAEAPAADAKPAQ